MRRRNRLEKKNAGANGPEVGGGRRHGAKRGGARERGKEREGSPFGGREEKTECNRKHDFTRKQR